MTARNGKLFAQSLMFLTKRQSRREVADLEGKPYAAECQVHYLDDLMSYISRLDPDQEEKNAVAFIDRLWQQARALTPGYVY